MPLADFARYSVGVTPSGDVAAQIRTKDYLSETVAILNRKASTAGDDDAGKQARGQLSLIKSVYELLLQYVGSYRWVTAEKYWKYWDKNKRQIIAAHEGKGDEETIMDVIGVIEDGRYYHN